MSVCWIGRRDRHPILKTVRNTAMHRTLIEMPPNFFSHCILAEQRRREVLWIAAACEPLVRRAGGFEIHLPDFPFVA